MFALQTVSAVGQRTSGEKNIQIEHSECGMLILKIWHVAYDLNEFSLTHLEFCRLVFVVVCLHPVDMLVSCMQENDWLVE